MYISFIQRDIVIGFIVVEHKSERLFLTSSSFDNNDFYVNIHTTGQ